MTIHFAAARTPLTAMLRSLRASAIIGRAANDNAGPGHSAELRAALRHFAIHGLGAANVARRNAEKAFFQGDREAYLHWHTICRTLDRRMAAALSDRVEAGND